MQVKSHEQRAEKMFGKKEFDVDKFVAWVSGISIVFSLIILYFKW